MRILAKALQKASARSGAWGYYKVTHRKAPNQTARRCPAHGLPIRASPCNESMGSKAVHEGPSIKWASRGTWAPVAQGNLTSVGTQRAPTNAGRGVTSKSVLCSELLQEKEVDFHPSAQPA